MREATGFNFPAATFSILEDSWRGSTRRQYQSIWKLWNHWCSNQLLNSTSISVSKLLDYLQSLVDHGFAWQTIGVHRSAISSILEPHKTVPVGQHPLVCCFMKGVFNVKPPTACERSVSCVDGVAPVHGYRPPGAVQESGLFTGNLQCKTRQ